MVPGPNHGAIKPQKWRVVFSDWPFYEDMVQPLDNLPDIWGEGAIFAFSGLDGPTDTLSQFVATLGDEWHPGDGFCYDRDFSGRFTGVKAVSGFLPLLLDDIPPSHVDRLAAHLDDPTTFAAPFPVPSVALDHPTWSTDMWRRATWINMNCLIVIGLRKHGRRLGVPR